MCKSIIVIGGSAGSFSIVTQVLSELPKNFSIPIILCLHRLKHIRSGFAEALSLKSSLPVVEPFDKESIEEGKIYIAPANYHLYIETNNTFSLSTEEPVNHSRPSIDLTFISAANNYKENTIGVILSGANNDGAYGLKRIKDFEGTTIIQCIEESQVATMPSSALKLMKPDFIMKSDEITNFLIEQNQIFLEKKSKN